jgi:hypothetical protein
MQGLRASHRVARLGGVLVVLLAVGLLGVIVKSFLDQQHGRIAAVHAEQDGLAFARPVTRMLDRIGRARLEAARYGTGDKGARYRYAAARLSTLQTLADIKAAQRRSGNALDTADAVSALERSLAVLLPREVVGGLDAQRAYGAIADKALRLLAQIRDGSGLILDAQTETYALVDATVAQLPALMDAGGRALALTYLSGRHTDLAVAKGTVQTSLRRLEETLGQRGGVPIDDALYRALRPALHKMLWDTGTLIGDLTTLRHPARPVDHGAAARLQPVDGRGRPARDTLRGPRRGARAPQAPGRDRGRHPARPCARRLRPAPPRQAPARPA